MTSAHTESRARPPDTDRKAVLFCPDCGHRSLVNGDWIVEDDTDEQVRDVVCPDCSEHLTSRPLSPADPGGRAPTDSGGSDPATVTALADVWLSTVAFWLRVPPRVDSTNPSC